MSTENQTPDVETEEGININCAEAKLCIVYAGEFPDKTDPTKLIQFEDSIKIKVGKLDLKLSPFALAAIVRATQDKDVKPILQSRLAQQKKEMSELGF